MKKMKLALSLILVLALALSLFAACAKTETPANTDTTPAKTDTTPAKTDEPAKTEEPAKTDEPAAPVDEPVDPEDIVDVVFYVIDMNNAHGQDHQERLTDVVNAITEPKGIHVNLNYLMIGDWISRVQTSIAGGERIDLMCFCIGNGGALTLSAGGGDAIVNLKDCTFRNNATDANSMGAAILVQKGKLTATRCLFTENGAKNGSAIAVSNSNADLELTYCSFTNNSSSNCGGVLNLSHGKILFENCSFKGNRASGYAGGALHTNGSNSELTCKECTFESNESYGHGGAVSLEEGIVKLIACTFKNNKSSQSNQNSASNGGGAVAMLKANGQVHLSDCDFIGNETYGTGGAIYQSQGRLYIDKCRIAGTNANNRAALRLNNGLCYINRSSITGTQVPGDWGVAIQATNLGALCMNNVTITGNTGKNDKDPSVNGTANYLIVNSTLADHSTVAGLRIEGGKKAVLLNSILVNTLSSAPAVLFSGDATVTWLGNCIVGYISGADGSTKIYTPGEGDKSNVAYSDLSMGWDSSKNVCTWTGTLEGHTQIAGGDIAALVKTALPVSVTGSVTVDGSSQTAFTVSNAGDDFHSWVTGIESNGFAVDALGNSRGAASTCGAWQAQ